MKPARRLVLTKETLADLTTAELGSVAGAQVQTPQCPSVGCYSDPLECLVSIAINPCLTD